MYPITTLPELSLKIKILHNSTKLGYFSEMDYIRICEVRYYFEKRCMECLMDHTKHANSEEQLIINTFLTLFDNNVWNNWNNLQEE